MNIESEDDWQEYLAAKMSESGWYVKREVTPSEDNCRADIIAKHSEIGDEWIGIEAKKWHSAEASHRAIYAVNQILEKYRYKHWPNKTIRLWAVAPYIGGSYEKSQWGVKNRFAEKVICNMINELGIGYLQHHSRYAGVFFGINSSADNWAAGPPAFPLSQDPFKGYMLPQDLKEAAAVCEARQPEQPLGIPKSDEFDIKNQV